MGLRCIFVSSSTLLFLMLTCNIVSINLINYVQKEETHLRTPISPGARLEATLLYLITGIPYSRLAFQTRISEQALGKIVPETCEAIYSCLKDQYLQVSFVELLFLNIHTDTWTKFYPYKNHLNIIAK